MADGTQRRLTTIVAADIAGFSRLVGNDEEGTLAAHRGHRAELIEPLLADHQGRIANTAGDSFLLEFQSAVEAVRCSMAMQDGMAKRNRNIPADRRIEYRIGINVGDVVADGNDLLGDGVNIAARLENICEPGGIALSDDAYRQVRDRIDLAWEDGGEHEVKNIARPVRVWRLGKVSAVVSTPSNDVSLALPDKPSIAVLPFDNMSGDPEQEFFADGITEDLITALSKIRWFFVIARNSTFTYKGQAIEVRQVSRELGVRYVVEGSIRKGSDRMRISAQLIDATTGRHVWAEHYDREIEDIFALQDEMTQTIVAAIEPELGAFERDRALRKPPQSLDAWETYQRGLWHMWSFTKNDNADALPLLQRARKLDPNFAAAYAYEGYSHFLNAMLGYSETPGESLAAALVAAKKAATLDDKDPAAYLTLGRVHMMQGEHDTSIAELERCLSLNPNFAAGYFAFGFALALVGRLDEALETLDTAVRLNPRDPLIWAIKALRSLIHCLLSQYEAAAESAQQSIREPRAAGYWPYAVLAAALGNLGRIEEARSAIAGALEQKPDLSISYLEMTLPTKQPGGLQQYLEGLRKAGLIE